RKELLVVVLTLGVFLGAGIPVVKETVRRQHRAECIANLKQMDGALCGWALEDQKRLAKPFSFADTSILQYLKGRLLPLCPDGGIYSAGPVPSAKSRVNDPLDSLALPVCSLS